MDTSAFDGSFSSMYDPSMDIYRTDDEAMSENPYQDIPSSEEDQWSSESDYGSYDMSYADDTGYSEDTYDEWDAYSSDYEYPEESWETESTTGMSSPFPFQGMEKIATALKAYSLFMSLFAFIIIIISIISKWRIFTKMGEKGWKSIIPLLSSYTRISLLVKDKSLVALKWLIYLFLFPIRGVYEIYLNIRLCRVFGRSDLFTTLMTLFPILSVVIAFDSSMPVDEDTPRVGNKRPSDPVQNRGWDDPEDDMTESYPAAPVPKVDWRNMEDNRDDDDDDMDRSVPTYDEKSTPLSGNTSLNINNVPDWDDDESENEIPPAPKEAPRPSVPARQPAPMPPKPSQAAPAQRKRVQKCPSCGGTLTKSPDGAAYICDSCGKRFVVKKKN